MPSLAYGATRLMPSPFPSILLLCTSFTLYALASCEFSCRLPNWLSCLPVLACMLLARDSCERVHHRRNEMLPAWLLRQGWASLFWWRVCA